MSNVSFIRFVIFITLVGVWYFQVFLVAVPLTIWYLYNFRAYELIMLGVLIDAYFMTSVALPQYTLGFASAFAMMEFLKPRLRHNKQL